MKTELEAERSDRPARRDRVIYILGIVTVGSSVLVAVDDGTMLIATLNVALLIANVVGLRWHNRLPTALPVVLCGLNAIVAFLLAWNEYSGGSTAIHIPWAIAGVGFLGAAVAFVVRGRRRASAPPT
ncbi:MAG: hypothetical protein AAGE94_13545 [Acidobacteriota bacterium]